MEEPGAESAGGSPWICPPRYSRPLLMLAVPPLRTLLLCAALLTGACGTRADYELLHLRELVRQGDREAVREHHALLSPALTAIPAVRELLLATELEALGLDPLELLAQLPVGLENLPAMQAEVPADFLPEDDLARLVALASTGIQGPPSPTALRLESATLLLAGMSMHRGGNPAGVDLCLIALDGLAGAVVDEDAGLGALGSQAERILDQLDGPTSADPGAAATLVAGGADPGAASVLEAGSSDPRRTALARFLGGAP